MTSQNNLEERLRSTEEECERLRAENAGLRAMLGIQNSTSRKDADPDIPILIAAKSEYAKLK
jgi:hypothetical protein